MNITQTTHSAKNLLVKIFLAKRELEPRTSLIRGECSTTELLGAVGKPQSDQVFIVVLRSRYTVQTHKQDKTYQCTGSINDAYPPSLVFRI